MDLSVVSDPFNSPEFLPFPIHKFTAQQYQELGQLGVLGPDDKVELLEGMDCHKNETRRSVCPRLTLAIPSLGQTRLREKP